eukprot:scaffold47017_cov24-Tisochrysis_lutea.AAC.2
MHPPMQSIEDLCHLTPVPWLTCSCSRMAPLAGKSSGYQGSWRAACWCPAAWTPSIQPSHLRWPRPRPGQGLRVCAQAAAQQFLILLLELVPFLCSQHGCSNLLSIATEEN